MTTPSKEVEIMAFLQLHVFGPILNSTRASERLKQGVRMTIMRMNQGDTAGMVNFYWSAIVGTERSVDFADDMRREGFARFEDPGVIDEVRHRFDDAWLRQP
jgi:hypothetical protein